MKFGSGGANRFHHARSRRRIDGTVRVKLLTGKTIVVEMPGAPPSILLLEASTGSSRDARVACKRTGLEEYEQMTIDEMVEAGLLSRRPNGAETENTAGHDGPGSSENR